MGKLDEFWDSVPSDEEGQTVWPSDPANRSALVRQVFGAKVIGALEAVLAEQIAIAEGQLPEPGRTDYQLEAARRQVFAEMTDVERSEVKRLVKGACFRTLYWILVKLEHFPQGNVDFVVEPLSPSGEVLPPVSIEETELHHLYFDWVERFSDEGDE